MPHRKAPVTQKWTLRLIKVQRVRDCEILSHKQNICTTPPPLRLQEPEVREDWSEMEPSGHDTAIALMISRRLRMPTHHQVSQRFSRGGGGPRKLPPLADKLLAVDDFCRRNSHISLRVWSLMHQPCSSRWFNTYEIMDGGKTWGWQVLRAESWLWMELGKRMGS